MTDHPEAVLQRYFDAFARHALPEMLELRHEDVQAFYPAEPQRIHVQYVLAGGKIRAFYHL